MLHGKEGETRHDSYDNSKNVGSDAQRLCLNDSSLDMIERAQRMQIWYCLWCAFTCWMTSRHSSSGSRARLGAFGMSRCKFIVHSCVAPDWQKCGGFVGEGLNAGTTTAKAAWDARSRSTKLSQTKGRMARGPDHPSYRARRRAGSFRLRARRESTTLICLVDRRRRTQVDPKGLEAFNGGA